MTKPIEIPVRLDHAEAVAGLDKIGKAGHKAGDDVHEGMKHAKGATESLLGAMMETAAFEKGIELVTQFGEAVAESMKNSVEHSKQLAEEFIKIQDAMQKVASMTGQKNTGAFTQDQIKQAAQANLTPEEWMAGKGAMGVQGGQFIGKGPESKISQAAADKAFGTLGEYAKSRGGSAETMGEIAGAVIAQHKGAFKEGELEEETGKLAKILKGAGGTLEEQVSNLRKGMATGMDATEAAKMVVLASQAAPGKAGLLINAAGSALAQERQAGNIGEGQGVKSDMDDYETIRALTKHVVDKTKDVAPEKRQGAILEQIKEFTKNQQLTKLISRQAGKGMGLFDVLDSKEAGGGTKAMDESIKEFRESDVGERQHTKAVGAEIRSRRGPIEAEKEEALAKAGNVVEERGDELKGGTGWAARAMFAGTIGKLGAIPGAKQQLINTEALRATRDRAHGMGINTFDPNHAESRYSPGYLGGAESQYTVNKEIERVLGLIHKELEKQTPHVVAAAAPPPLTNKQPAVGANVGRMGG